MHLDLLHVLQQLMELLVKQDSFYQLHLPIVLNVHHHLQHVLHLLLFNHVNQHIILHQSVDLMLHVQLAQLQEMLLNALILHMLPVVNQDFMLIMDNVLHVQIMQQLNVLDQILFNVILDII